MTDRRSSPTAREGRIALLSDAHLGGPGGGAAPLVAQLEALPGEGCSRLVLMGDLFQAWIGIPRFETPEIAAVVPVLRDLRRQGLRLDYIEGNRDFYLGRGPYADAFDAVATEVAFTAAGTRYLAVHGDGLNERDWQYRFWRRLSKSRPVELVVRRTPHAFARRMVASTEERLSRTNFRHKRELPERAIRAYAERRLAEGHDVLLLGHFHEPRTFKVSGGEVRLLDAWFRSRRLEWLG